MVPLMGVGASAQVGNASDVDVCNVSDVNELSMRDECSRSLPREEIGTSGGSEWSPSNVNNSVSPTLHDDTCANADWASAASELCGGTPGMVRAGNVMGSFHSCSTQHLRGRAWHAYA